MIWNKSLFLVGRAGKSQKTQFAMVKKGLKSESICSTE